MSEPLLYGAAPEVNRDKVGISYSGGGPLVLIELGIAQAFVDLRKEKKIPPIAAIAGVSAGALAGTAHALDPENGEGIAIALEVLQGVSEKDLKLDTFDIVIDVLSHGVHLISIGDNAVVQKIAEQIFGRLGKLPTLKAADFTQPRLFIGATDRIAGRRVWFPDDSPSTPIAEALVASSAIPGIFPWKEMMVGDSNKWLVDGGVTNNQPLSRLAMAGCGTIYSCGVGYDGGRLKQPANALDNALQSIAIVAHEATRLEQECVELKLGNQGTVHHIHPEVEFPISGYNFTDSTAVRKVFDDACAATKKWIDPALLPMPVAAAASGP